MPSGGDAGWRREGWRRISVLKRPVVKNLREGMAETTRSGMVGRRRDCNLPRLLEPSVALRDAPWGEEVPVQGGGAAEWGSHHGRLIVIRRPTGPCKLINGRDGHFLLRKLRAVLKNNGFGCLFRLTDPVKDVGCLQAISPLPPLHGECRWRTRSGSHTRHESKRTSVFPGSPPTRNNLPLLVWYAI